MALLDHHPAHRQVVLASPCSGHGYKFCSVVGEVLADLATTGATGHPIDLFDPRRPAGGDHAERLVGRVQQQCRAVGAR